MGVNFVFDHYIYYYNCYYYDYFIIIVIVVHKCDGAPGHHQEIHSEALQ